MNAEEHMTAHSSAMAFTGYATVHGSTRSIAERLAQRLQTHGLSVAVEALSPDTHLPDESAVVIGSAVHDRDWLPVANAFLRAHSSELADRSVWLFSVGMPASLPGPLRRLGAFEHRAITRRIGQGRGVRGTAIFSGVVLADHFPKALSRLVFRAMGCHYGDFRDWAQVDTWADEIAADLSR